MACLSPVRSGEYANRNQGADGMKKNLANEPLLNVIARQVGRAAGTIAKASKLIAPEVLATVNLEKAAKPRKKSKLSAAPRKPTSKKKIAKSSARKSRSKPARSRTKKTS
jgi:hypothetical protein